MFPEFSSTPDFCGELCSITVYRLLSSTPASCTDVQRYFCNQWLIDHVTLHPGTVPRQSQPQIGEYLRKPDFAAPLCIYLPV